MKLISEKIKNIYQDYPLFLIGVSIVLINIFIKSIFITSVPSTITYDEMYYLAEAQSIARTGSDITGSWKPWHLAPAHAMYSELTSTTLALGFVLFPNNPVLAIKVIPILLGSFLPLLLGLIVYRLTFSKRMLVCTALIATVNPWIFQFSRMSFDSLFSSFFYNLGIVALLWLPNKKKLWSIVPFFWGFFQYQGHKPLLVPLVFVCLVFLFLEIKESSWKKKIITASFVPAAVVAILSVLITGVYLVRLPNLTASSRISEFSLFDNPTTAANVVTQRHFTLTNPLESLVANKYTLALNDMVGRFVSSFNLDWLFVRGNDAVDTFAVRNFGYLYLLDILLILAGLVSLFSSKKLRNSAFFIVGYIFVGTIPNVVRIGGLWITFRGSFVIFGLLLLAGIGMSSLISGRSKIVKTVIIFLYFLGTVPFFYNYFFQYPVQAAGNGYFFERVLADYVKRNPEQPMMLVVDHPQGTLEYLLTYNAVQKIAAPLTRESLSGNTITHGSIIITNHCPADETFATMDPQTVIAVDYRREPCTPPNLQSPKVSLSSPIDSGTRYHLLNEQFCSQYNLPPYIHIKENKFDLRALSNEEFCKTYFMHD